MGVEVKVLSLVSTSSSLPCVGEALWHTCGEGVIEGLVHMQRIGANIPMVYHVIGL